jgi:hypothetical protein
MFHIRCNYCGNLECILSAITVLLHAVFVWTEATLLLSSTYHTYKIQTCVTFVSKTQGEKILWYQNQRKIIAALADMKVQGFTHVIATDDRHGTHCTRLKMKVSNIFLMEFCTDLC